MHNAYKKISRFGLLAILLALMLNTGCRSIKFDNKKAEPVSHDTWDKLLKKHVNENGMVDYKGFIADSVEMQSYLRMLEASPPNVKTWSQNEVMAYWINAYNAYTVDIVMRNYPVKSIKDIGPSVTLPFVNTVWDIKFIEISGAKMDLNNIEHKMLRKAYGDPRIHFAVVCASASCPILRNEAFVAERLDLQLDEQGRIFLADDFRNKVSENKLQLSNIFNWYKGDFTEEGDLISYIQKFTDVKISKDASIDWLDYDWSLNDQKE